MIQFIGVSKLLDDRSQGPRLFLREVTAALPTDKVCDIETEGNDAVQKSHFLRLTCGAVKPERGKIHYGHLRVSPLLNAGNIPTLLFNQMTVRQNVMFQARMSHFNTHRLMEFVAESCSLQDKLDKPLATLNWPMRRAVEASIFTAIPYDCYLIDFLETVPDFALLQLYFAAKKRGAGIFFASSKPALGESYRDMSIVLRAGQLHGVSRAGARP
jgi:capsular polysaccharide transport system ATP-binding protein